MENEFDFYKRYNQLYLQYKNLYKSMLENLEYTNLTNKTAIELSILTQKEYPDKLQAIERANFLFLQEHNLNNLKELLSLYESIKG